MSPGFDGAYGSYYMAREICLGGPAINFTVGSETKGHKSFHVPLSILAEYSTFFSDLHYHCSLGVDGLNFALIDIDPAIFNRFTIWLYYQGIYIDEWSANQDPLEYYEQLEQLWTLADKYRVLQLQRQAEDVAIQLLRALQEQYGFDIVSHWHCIYANSCVSSPQRRFIAGQCVRVSAKEKMIDPEMIHPALRGDIVDIVRNLWPQFS